MADDHTQRPYRSNEPPARNTPAAASDPLAELARLIGQNDPFAEFGRDSARRAAPSSAPAWSAPAAQSQSEAPPATPKYGASGYYAASTAPAAPPPEAQPYGAPVTRQPHANSPYAANADRYRTEDETPDYPTAPAGYRAGAYQQNQMPHAGEEDEIYDDAPPPRRRIGIMAIAAVFALAVIGTAGAFGYRAMFGSSGANLSPPVIKSDTAQIKVVPASTGKTSGKLITERLTDHAQDEKLVSREEKPVEVTSTPPAGAMTPSQDGAPQSANQAALGSGVISSEPKKVHTIAIHPDQASLGNSQPPAAAAAPTGRAFAGQADSAVVSGRQQCSAGCGQSGTAASTASDRGARRDAGASSGRDAARQRAALAESERGPGRADCHAHRVGARRVGRKVSCRRQRQLCAVVVAAQRSRRTERIPRLAGQIPNSA